MEKLFRPNKWFVMYCGLFIVLWAVLQYVSNARLKEDAQKWGAYVFNWTWPGDNWSSTVQIVEANVLDKNEHDAVVTVKGKQELRAAAGGGHRPMSQIADCSATLKFYKRTTDKGEIWELGEVKFP